MDRETPSHPQTDELLRRILTAVEPPKRKRGFEIARAFDSRLVRTVLAFFAVIMFLATLAGLLTMPVCHE